MSTHTQFKSELRLEGQKKENVGRSDVGNKGHLGQHVKLLAK